MAKDPRIDAYIDKAADFARPILGHLRALVHEALPQAQETIKWGMPHFMVGGKNIAGIAAFKAHCAFVIHGEGRQGVGDGMGQYGKIAALEDLPSQSELTTRLQEMAARLSSRSAGMKKPVKEPKAEIEMPDDFASALAGTAGAQAHYDAFSPSAKREYLEWIVSAKGAATRERRIAQAAEWIGEGKKRNWKYERC